MEQATNNQNWEQVFSVIQKSFTINKHVEFFNWLQGSVSQLLPHDVLVAAWGDFTTGELNFDVSSNIEDIRTQKLNDAPGVFSYLMSNLHQRWIDGGERWFRINFFDAAGINSQSPTPFTRKLARCWSKRCVKLYEKNNYFPHIGLFCTDRARPIFY